MGGSSGGGGEDLGDGLLESELCPSLKTHMLGPHMLVTPSTFESDCIWIWGALKR